MKPLRAPWSWLLIAATCAPVAYLASHNWAVRGFAFALIATVLVWLLGREARKTDILRKKAGSELGDRFDPAAFDAMLSSADFTKGPVAHQVDAWIAAEKAKL